MLYNANLTNLNNLTGDQIGSYFGYSVASGDLNGDGLDDVIIGAPMWTNYQTMGKFETGKVFVAYQNQNVSTKSNNRWEPCPGLVVMGEDSCSGGRGFESQHHSMLDRHIFAYNCSKNCIVFEKMKINGEEAGDGPLKSTI